MNIFQLMKSKSVLGVAIFSLLLAITLCVFWVRSYMFYDAFFYSNLERSHQLFTIPGAAVFSTWNHRPSEGFSGAGVSGPVGSTPMKLYRNGKEQELSEWDHPPGMHGGFWWDKGVTQLVEAGGNLYPQTHINLALPFWALVLFFLLPPVAWGLKLWQRYQRARTGRCIYCNAIMPTPDRCPSCGTEFESWAF